MIACADDGNDFIMVQVGITAIIQQGGRVITIQQSLGILFICNEKWFDFVLFNKSNFLFRFWKVNKRFNGFCPDGSNTFYFFKISFLSIENISDVEML